MKTIKITLLFLFMFAAFNTTAQEETQEPAKNDEIKTLFKKTNRSHGFYGSLMAGYTQIDGKNGFCYGFNVARMIGHSLGIGMAGSGFSNEYFLGHQTGAHYQSLQGGYGGFFIEPSIFPKFPVHVSFPVLLGIGGVVQMDAWYWDQFDYDYAYEDADLFFVAEPGLDIELNLLKHLRLGIGAKYRFTTHTILQGIQQDALNGYSVNMSLKFGKF